MPLFLGVGLALTAGTSASAKWKVDLTINILAPLTASITQDLHFGTIVPSATQASTVSVIHNFANSSTCGASLTCLQDGNRAALQVAGQPMYRFTVTVPSSAQLSNGNGATMIMDDFRVGRDGNGNAYGSAFRLESDGTQNLYIGATLHVDANQPVGFYTGTYTVTTAYE